MLDKPVSGRIFFDQAIRDNLDIGHPDQISLVFDRRIQNRKRRPTPGRFRTHVITDGVTPEPARRLQELQDQAVPHYR